MSDIKDLAIEALRLFAVYEATPADRGGVAGPKGRAWAAFQSARVKALTQSSGAHESRPSGKSDNEFRTDYEIGLDNGYALASTPTAEPKKAAGVEAEPVAFEWRAVSGTWKFTFDVHEAAVLRREGKEVHPLYSASALSALRSRNAELERERDEALRETRLLAEAIATAAKKAGIYNGEVPLTGPHLLMFCEDLAEHAERAEAEIAKLKALLAQADEDKTRLNTLASESWDLRCFDIPTGAGDADVGWRVVGHWQAKPHERTIAEVHHDDPRAAIDAARQFQEARNHG